MQGFRHSLLQFEHSLSGVLCTLLFRPLLSLSDDACCACIELFSSCAQVERKPFPDLTSLCIFRHS